MAKKGRPTRYSKALLPRAAKYARYGMTNEEIAEALGVTTSTFGKWLHDHPEFSDTVKKGRENKDGSVERTLLERALGYDYIDVVKEFDSEGNVIRTKEMHKHQPPEVVAQIFWLKNRKPAEWRDKKDIAVEGQIIFRPERIEKIANKKQITDVSDTG